jgi:hypothetical protein
MDLEEHYPAQGSTEFRTKSKFQAATETQKFGNWTDKTLCLFRILHDGRSPETRQPWKNYLLFSQSYNCVLFFHRW